MRSCVRLRKLQGDARALSHLSGATEPAGWQDQSVGRVWRRVAILQDFAGPATRYYNARMSDAAPIGTSLIDPARLDAPGTEVRREPFAFVIAQGQLPASARTALNEDFPRYSGAGFFPTFTVCIG